MSDVLVENSTSPQVKLLYECREGFKGKDVNRFGKPFHKDFRRIFHPRTLGKQPLSKEEHLEQTKGLFAAPVQFETIFLSIVETPGKLVAHTSTSAKGHPGLSTELEAIWIVEFTSDEEGNLKIKQIEEFADTKTHEEWSQALKLSK